MFESCICYDVDDVCTLLSRTQPTAHKEHMCCECRQIIKPGQKYERDATVFEGDFAVYKTCIPCLNVRHSMLPCGFYYGSLWDDIHQEYCHGHDEDDDDEDNYCLCPKRWFNK